MRSSLTIAAFMGRKDWDFCLASFAGDLAQKVFRESVGFFQKSVGIGRFLRQRIPSFLVDFFSLRSTGWKIALWGCGVF